MKSIILIAVALVAIAAAAPTEKKEVHVIFETSEHKPDGSYHFGYETDDGSAREETGVVKEALNEDNELQKVIIVSGSYTYLNNGIPETIKYYADETGFHAVGESIPKVVSN